MKKSAVILFIVVLAFFCVRGSAHAAQLNLFSDTITTSRPSASAPLSANAASTDYSETIVDNKSIFIASDSAKFLPDTGETGDFAVNVASMSALSGINRTLFFSQQVGHTHHKGDPVIVPITAMHTIQFTTQTFIPTGGSILITFPGAANNSASPSATTFAFNGLVAANIKSNNATACTFTINAPTITCAVSTSINPNTVITFLIGCSAATGASCTTQVPTLINPTRNPNDATGGALATTNTADNWKINVQSLDGVGTGNILDNSSTTVGTIESVQVTASVDPTLTFSIAGIGNAVALNTSHGASCPTDTTNSGFAALGASVNLGTLVASTVNMSAQDLTISTNEAAGYSLTATASGALQDPSNGYSLFSNTTPAVLAALPIETFGIHPCGTDVSTGTWAPTLSGTTAGQGKIGWPNSVSSATTLTVASRVSAANSIVTTVEYIGTVSGTTPAGTYGSTITYVATPTFN